MVLKSGFTSDNSISVLINPVSDNSKVLKNSSYPIADSDSSYPTFFELSDVGQLDTYFYLELSDINIQSKINRTTRI